MSESQFDPTLENGLSNVFEISSGCRSCGYEGGLMDHLSEKQECFEAHVKHYISKEQPEDNSDDYLKRKLMFELSAVLNTCA